MGMGCRKLAASWLQQCQALVHRAGAGAPEQWGGGGALQRSKHRVAASWGHGESLCKASSWTGSNRQAAVSTRHWDSVQCHDGERVMHGCLGQAAYTHALAVHGH